MDYFEKQLRRCAITAEQISKIRWDFIAKANPKVVLDYGSGSGFFRAYRPKGIVVDSYDIAQYPQTGILHEFYNLICFWDVLEHIPDLGIVEPLLKKTDFVALSVPIKPSKIKWKDWKHFRPLEHLHNFDLDELDAMFEFFGFTKIDSGQIECPPRTDIWDILYKRMEKEP